MQGNPVLYEKPDDDSTCLKAKLKKVHELFQGAEDVHSQVQNEVPFTIYPLAFTHDLSNVKATGLMPNFACWTKAKFHVIQLGMVTSAFAGSGAKTATGKCHWDHQMKFCDQGLPHISFSQKVVSRPLQWQMWSHPSILAPIKDMLIAFQLNIIPELFKCVTYPITALINLIWGKHVKDLKDGKIMDPCMIKFVLMLEYTLNYAHTGNAAILCKKLMDHAWLSLEWSDNAAIPQLANQTCNTQASDIVQVVPRTYIWPRPLQGDIALKVYLDNIKQVVHGKVIECLNPTIDANDQALRHTTWDHYMALSCWMDEPRILEQRVLPHL
ncbi:hypothetical protein EDC04DRAFT_2607559 [Pisolithus marmoratus]|nr:hypothetical protein EDC04DRAFT_2607559 [Pisolithus marmoratus]